MARPKKEETSSKKKHEEEKPRRSIKEIMDTIIDTESLKKRKTDAEKKAKDNVKPITFNKVEYKMVRETYERDKFSIKQYQGSFYVHYDDWSEDVYSGPYETKEISEKLIDDYIGGNGKNPMDYEVPNIHSIILHID